MSKRIVPIVTELKGVTYCLVRIPFMAISYMRYKVDNKLSILFGSRTKTGDFSSIETLPKGNWQIVGLGKNLTADECHSIIEHDIIEVFIGDPILYKDYKGRPGIDYYTDAFFSLKSWLISVGADENYMILKLVK